jgi:hypothetical protein
MNDTQELPGPTDLAEQLYRVYKDVDSGALSLTHGLSVARELSAATTSRPPSPVCALICLPTVKTAARTTGWSDWGAFRYSGLW